MYEAVFGRGEKEAPKAPAYGGDFKTSEQFTLPRDNNGHQVSTLLTLHEHENTHRLSS